MVITCETASHHLSHCSRLLYPFLEQFIACCVAASWKMGGRGRSFKELWFRGGSTWLKFCIQKLVKKLEIMGSLVEWHTGCQNLFDWIVLDVRNGSLLYLLGCSTGFPKTPAYPTQHPEEPWWKNPYNELHHIQMWIDTGG